MSKHDPDEAVAAGAMLAAAKRGGFSAKERERKRFLWMLMTPTLVFYTIFVAVPCLLGLIISFFYWKGVTLNLTFAGFANYKSLINDTSILKVMGNHLFVWVFNTLCIFIIALVCAMFLSRSVLKEKNFYRTLFFFPSAVPVAIIAIMFMCVYNPDTGLLNGLLKLIGATPQNWLASSSLVKPSIVAVMVWKSFGWYMVLFMAAILNIPTSLYEAATIDGCGPFRQIFKIIIPLIWEVIRTTLVFFVSTSCTVGFSVIFMLTKGGPDKASDILPTYMYDQAFTYSKYGYGTAIGVLTLVITMTLSLIILKVTEREVYEF